MSRYAVLVADAACGKTPSSKKPARKGREEDMRREGERKEITEKGEGNNVNAVYLSRAAQYKPQLLKPTTAND